MSAAPAKTAKFAPADTASCFLYTGTDEFEAAQACRQKINELCPPAEQTFGLETIDGACDTVDESVAALRATRDALNTVGFFGAGKLVWLRDATFFYDSKPGKTIAVKEAVAALTEEIKRGLMPGVRLVVHATSVDKRTAFYKAMEKGGQVHLHDMPAKDYQWDEHAMRQLRGKLDEAGLRASHAVVHLFVERAGNQSRQLAIELEKLQIYLGDRREVTADDVMTIVSPARERGYGELANAFCTRDLAATLSVLRQLVHQKESPVGLVISLENRLRELLVYRSAEERGHLRVYGGDWPKIDFSTSPEAEAFFSHLPNDPRKANPFWAGKLAGWAMGFPPGGLGRCLRILVEEHAHMTEGLAAPETLLEWALIKCLGVHRERS